MKTACRDCVERFGVEKRNCYDCENYDGGFLWIWALIIAVGIISIAVLFFERIIK